MIKFIPLFCLGFCLVALLASATMIEKKPIDFFKEYITGDFDNRKQLALEAVAKLSHPPHPYAKHVNRRAESKIKNLPPKLNGFYILEESYYKYDNQPDTIIKPLLFFFEEMPNGNVKLHSLQLPQNIAPKDIRNDNSSLFFDYNELKPSPSFKPTEYVYTRKNGFYLKAVIEFPNGSFTLEETIDKDRLNVMETLIKDNKTVTPYTTPLLYERIK